MEKIEIKIHEVMGRHRIKQTELAEASGIHYTTLTGVYNGKVKRVDLDTLARLVKGLRRITGKPYSVADILEYSESEPQEASELEDATLLDHGVTDLRSQLAELEIDTLPEELNAWGKAFESRR